MKRSLCLVFIALLFAWPGCAKTPGPGGVMTGAGGEASLARDPLLMPRSDRTPPQKGPETAPVQVTFEPDPVLYADVSADGRWLAYVTGQEGEELWLRSADPGVTALPRLLTRQADSLSAPAFSPDGAWVAFAGRAHDVKGDIYVLRLDRAQEEPRRLTGRDTEDGAPRFSADGKRLIFHQMGPGADSRHPASLDFRLDRPQATVLEVQGDGAFPAPAPAGGRCAFVSFRKDAGGDIFLYDPTDGGARPLTEGPDRDLFPVWSPDGRYVYFTRFALDTDRDGAVNLEDKGVIFRVSADSEHPTAYPVTSAAYGAYHPVVSGDRLYFLSSRRGASNLWALPLEGEIPGRDRPEDQARLARQIQERIPPDPFLAILAHFRVMERFSGEGPFGGRAAYAVGELYEQAGLQDAARKAYETGSALYGGTLPEAALCRIQLAFLEAGERTAGDGREKGVPEARARMDAVASAHPGLSRVQAKARIQQARLLMSYGKDSKAWLEADRLLEEVIGRYAVERALVAEAMVLRADLFTQMGRADKVFPLYAEVVREYPDVPNWADRAVDRILSRDLSQVPGEEGYDGQVEVLLRVAERYREELPRLSMGAWNRIGDLHFAAGEWERAKTAYRHVLERTDEADTQSAAARLALAEILYREERFRETLDLYEKEMASRPQEDHLYRLARAGYVRKSIAAAEFLFRLGEVPAARDLFAQLLREDDRVVEAHRGYIKCAAARREIPQVLGRYRARLERDPDDPLSLYGAGLCLTYVGGREAMEEARSLIEEALQRNAQVAYYHQTLGYIFEIQETLYGERGGLEKALEAYQRAAFLNDPEINPENAANLALNLGNMFFLLGQYAKAFESYTERFESGVPFDQEETEILFYRRFGAAAFQVRERERPILAFQKALDLLEERIQPQRASEILGRVNRTLFDRILTPALQAPGTQGEARVWAERQADLNRRLFEASRRRVDPPPDASWNTYRDAVASLIPEQEQIIAGLGPLIKEREGLSRESLAYMLERARDGLAFPERLMELKAAMLDRLGLAFQEAERWEEARQSFEKAYALNERLGLYKNLVSNQRSAAFNTYMEAGARSGEERERLLAAAAEAFGKVIERVRTYGVQEKAKVRPKKAAISLTLDIALDKEMSSQAMYGFTAEQEERLAQAFIQRIEIERGRLAPAGEAMERQLARYGAGAPIADEDRYGVSLLYHRAGHLAYALKDFPEAFERFRRSAELSLELESPVSAAINVANLAETLMRIPAEAEDGGQRRRHLAGLDRRCLGLLHRFGDVLDPLVIPSYHNKLGVLLMNQAPKPSPAAIQEAVREMRRLEEAGTHFAMGLKGMAEKGAERDRSALALQSALHLNMGRLAQQCGEGREAQGHFAAALELAEKGLLPQHAWRALAGLGRLEEALKTLEGVTLLRAGCGPGEVTGTFAPLVARLLEADRSEEAFNLVERLSEIERVQRITPLAVEPFSPEEGARLRRIYPRLLALEALRERMAAAEGADREYLESRLRQEQGLLERDLGPRREGVPKLARGVAAEAVQDQLMILAGLALDAEETADAAVGKGEGGEAEALRARYRDLMDRYGLRLGLCRALLREAEAPGLPGVLWPDPAELIDVMENLPEDHTLVRLYGLPDPEPGWAAWIVTPEGFEVQRSGTAMPAGLSADGRRVIAFEDPRAVPLRTGDSVALSASHLLRSIRARKPFKRTLLVLPPQYTVPGAFEVRSLAPGASRGEVLAALPGVQGILLGQEIGRVSSVPTRAGRLPQAFMAVALDQGRALPLIDLGEGLADVSLALLPGTAPEDAYPAGQLLALFGVPTVLLPQQAGGEDPARIEAFLQTYGSSSAREAAEAALSGREGEKAWMQMGYWGMGPEEARAFAADRFAHYVGSAVEAYKGNRPYQALLGFEKALSVARETEALQQHLPNLHKYAREAAFAADRLEQAVAHAEALVHILEKTGPGSEAHAEALLKLGLLQAKAERFEKAVPLLEEAVGITADLEMGPEQVAVLSDLGVVLENATEYDRALVQFESAATLSRTLDKKELLARQCRSIGRVHDLRLSQYARAKQFYREAHDVYRELGRRAAMAQLLLDIGRCDRLLGNFGEAESRYREALETLEGEEGEERLKAKILMEQANSAWFQARYQEAFDLQTKVYGLALEKGWPLEQVLALNTSGLTWWTLGDHERALRELEKALDGARRLEARKDEIATTLNNMGLVYREMGRYEKAMETLDQALAIDREIRSKWAVAYDLRNKALTLIRMGEAEASLPLFEEALTLAREIGNRVNEAKILLGRGEALAALDRPAEARVYFQEALTLSQGMAMREAQWRALYGLGLLSLKQGHREEALETLNQAIVVIEETRAAIKLDQLKDGFVADKMGVYEALVSLLVDLGRTAEAFDVAERSRARNLIDLLGNQRLSLQGAVDQEYYDRHKRLRARIGEQEALLATADGEEERAVYGRALNELRDAFRDLMLEIQARSPELASIVAVHPLDLEDIRALLEPDTALVAYYVLPEEILCWLIRPGGLELFRTPLGRPALELSVADYRRTIQNLEPVEQQSRQLYEWLMQPAASRLEGVRALGIVPHRALHYLSFGTLHSGETYLVDRLALFYLPSASVLKYTLARRQAEKNRRVLAIGNPSLGNAALELPFAEREVATIGWNFPDITVLTGEKATESWIVRNIGEFGIVHLASHGEFDPINPLFSSVKLVRDLEADGNLEASEVFGLKINADLVVLSACQTGLGKVTGGDDVIGMNRAFLYAGTHAMISSLWRVSDISTAILIKGFYREYAGRNKADSLRRAMLHVKNRYPHPGYWGAFVLVGDYL